MGKKSPPPAPDYTAAAERTARSNQEQNTAQTWANRPDVNTPWGSMTWQAQAGTDPATGQAITNWTQNINLSPDQQAALNDQMAIQRARSGGALALTNEAMRALGVGADGTVTPIDYSGVRQGGQSVTAPSGGSGPGLFSMGSAADHRGALNGVTDARQIYDYAARNGISPDQMDAMMGWETGQSARYIQSQGLTSTAPGSVPVSSYTGSGAGAATNRVSSLTPTANTLQSRATDPTQQIGSTPFTGSAAQTGRVSNLSPTGLSVQGTVADPAQQIRDNTGAGAAAGTNRVSSVAPQGNIQTSIAPQGSVQTGLASAGDISRTFQQPTQQVGSAQLFGLNTGFADPTQQIGAAQTQALNTNFSVGATGGGASIPGLDQFSRSAEMGGPYVRSVDPAGDFQTSAQAGRGVQYDFGQGNINLRTDVPGDVRGVRYETENSAGDWRSRAQQAALDFMRPIQQQRQQALESQLANMGLTRGSEAWRNELMRLQDQDMRDSLQAFGAGREESKMLFDQDLARSNFFNTAQSQAFDQGLSRSKLANDAQKQEFDQLLARGNFANSAQKQDFDQAVRNAELFNTAINDRNAFGLANAKLNNTVSNDIGQFNLNNAKLNNDALSSQGNLAINNQDLVNKAMQASARLGLDAQKMANDARMDMWKQSFDNRGQDAFIQNQQFNQNRSRADFFNDAQNDMWRQSFDNRGQDMNLQKQQFDQGLSAARFANEAQQQMFDQNLSSGQFSNDAQQQMFDQAVASGNFANSAQRQQYDQSLGLANFANNAQNQAFQQAMDLRGQDAEINDQQFQQNLSRSNLNNSAQRQQFDQGLASANFTNNAQDQAFDQNFRTRGQDADINEQQFQQNLANANLNNNVQRQQFDQGLSSANFANSAQDQAWRQGLTEAGFRNQAAAEQFANNMTASNTAFNRQSTRFDQNMRAQGFNQDLRNADLAELNSQRYAPLNSLNALLTGQQVQNPQFPSFVSANRAAGTDYTGAANAQYNAQMDAFNAQQAQTAGLMSGLFSLGGAAMTGGGWGNLFRFGP